MIKKNYAYKTKSIVLLHMAYKRAVEALRVEGQQIISFLENPYHAIEYGETDSVIKNFVYAYHLDKINVNEVRPCYFGNKRETLINFAAKCGKIELVALFLAMGANANIKDMKGSNAVSSACTRLKVPSDMHDIFFACDHKIYHDYTSSLIQSETYEYGECQSNDYPIYKNMMKVFEEAGVHIEASELLNEDVVYDPPTPFSDEDFESDDVDMSDNIYDLDYVNGLPL